MASWRYTPAALEDVLQIGSYTHDLWGEAQSERYLDTLETAFMRIAEIVALGRRRDDLAPGLLSHPVASHVVYFRRASGGVEILRVLHGRQSEAEAFAAPADDSFG